jgi:hypothetical protein
MMELTVVQGTVRARKIPRAPGHKVQLVIAGNIDTVKRAIDRHQAFAQHGIPETGIIELVQLEGERNREISGPHIETGMVGN